MKYCKNCNHNNIATFHRYYCSVMEAPTNGKCSIRYAFNKKEKLLSGEIVKLREVCVITSCYNPQYYKGLCIQHADKLHTARE